MRSSLGHAPPVPTYRDPHWHCPRCQHPMPLDRRPTPRDPPCRSCSAAACFAIFGIPQLREPAGPDPGSDRAYVPEFAQPLAKSVDLRPSPGSPAQSEMTEEATIAAAMAAMYGI